MTTENQSILTQRHGVESLPAAWRNTFEMHGLEWDAGYNAARIACADELAATLTQQQGGEQEVSWQNIETAEVEFLNNLAEKGGLADQVPGMLRHCAKLIDGLARFKTRATAPPDRYETEEEGDAFAHGYVAGFDDAKVATNS